MYNADTNTHWNEADMPFDFTCPWHQINRITRFVNRVETDAAMAGMVQDILIVFKVIGMHAQIMMQIVHNYYKTLTILHGLQVT